LSSFTKAAERTFVNHDFFGFPGAACTFNLNTGVIAKAFAVASASMTAIANGWWRIATTWNYAGTGTGPIQVVHNGTTTIYTGDGVSGLYVWGAQFEAGSVASSYIPTLAAAISRLADILVNAGNGVGGAAYSQSGGYGSLMLPCQAFVTAYRPASSGIPNVAGYGISTGAYTTPSQSEYASLAMVQGAVQDADIYAALDSIKAAGTTLWTRISS
jgi:hypothetical protein